MKGLLKSSNWLWLSSLIFIIILSGCAGPSPKNMVPSLGSYKSEPFNKSLNIGVVEGGRKAQFGGMETLTNETFKKAILSTLQNSRLFKEVRVDKESDYNLCAEITQQDIVNDKNLQYTSYLVVNYRLIKTNKKKEIWQKVIRSKKSVTVQEAFSGATRMTKAIEGATQNSLAQLVAEINKIPSL